MKPDIIFVYDQKWMKTSLIILLILIHVSSFGQETVKRPVYFGFKAHPTGFIIPHRDTLKDIASSTPRGIQFEISRFNLRENILAKLQLLCTNRF